MNALSKYKDKNIAIQCPTKFEAEQVSKLMAEMGMQSLWHHWGESKEYEEGFCLSPRNRGEYCYKKWYEEQGYEIIQASDVLKPKSEIINDYSIF